MAYWHKRYQDKAYLYYYDAKRKKYVQLPRKLTRHLDGEPKKEWEVWRQQWMEDQGLAKAKVERIVVRPKSLLGKLTAGYLKHRNETVDRLDSVARDERVKFETYVHQYFVGIHQKHNPKNWHKHVPGFLAWLHENFDLALSTKKDILRIVERFGKYLVYIGHMTAPFTLILPRANKKRETPLKARIEPEQVLTFARAKAITEPLWAFYALLAYFGSLRPSELYAVHREDFITGTEAKMTARTFAGFRDYNLGSGLSVKINKIMDGEGIQDRTKTKVSVRVVNIWHTDAAQLLGQLLKGIPTGKIAPFARDCMGRKWVEHVGSKLHCTAQDMRRASILYLGRSIRIPLTLLQEHAGHAEISTTMLYAREPAGGDQKTVAEQDFDDVV